MSEKKIPEIIFRDTYNSDKQEIHQDAYILKSKFDLLEAELKECKEGFTKQI